MKVRSFVLLCILISALIGTALPAWAHPAAQDATPTPRGSYVIGRDIYVRGGPGENYVPVGRLVEGARVIPLNISESGEWVLIQYYRGVGWIRRDLAYWAVDVLALPPYDEMFLTPTQFLGDPTETPFVPTATPTGNWIDSAGQGAFIRSGPNFRYSVIAQLRAGEVVEPVGRNEDSSWILIRVDDGFGWIAETLVQWAVDIDSLPVLRINALTPSPTFTPSYSPTPTNTPSATFTSSPTRTATPTETPSSTPTNTASFTPSALPTNTPRPTRTFTPTPTNTASPEPTATLTPTPTDTASLEPTATQTPTDTASPEPTATLTPTPTDTASLEPTATHTPTDTASPEPTATLTPPPTYTASLEPTATQTPTDTASPEPTATLMPTPTDTASPEPTATLTPPPTDTASPEPTATFTPTPTDTSTLEPTATLTPPPTDTASPEPTATLTPPPTDTSTLEPTATHTPTDTASPEPTATFTPTDTPTEAVAPLVVPTETSTRRLTDTPAPTETSTRRLTDTPAPTETSTRRPTNTPAPTDTPAPTETSTRRPTDTPAPTETSTRRLTDTPAPTETSTRRPTDTPAPTETPAGGASAANLTPSPEPSIGDTPTGQGGLSISFEAVIGALLLIAILAYVGLYWRGLAAADRYQNGFVIDTCPVCQRGHLLVETHMDRMLGIPRPRSTVRCGSCRSVLRQVGDKQWRYAVDPTENPALYARYNGKVLDEAELRTIRTLPRVVDVRPPVKPPTFVDDEES